MGSQISVADLSIVALYLIGVVGLGCYAGLPQPSLFTAQKLILEECPGMG